MKTYKILFLIFSFAGVLFSGYMSSIKFFSDTCAFGESCPYFLGVSACYFGFLMFLLLAIFSVLLSLNKWNLKSISKGMLIVSLLGVLFAGYFSVGEIPALFRDGFRAYVFGLPTCVMGGLFFFVVLIISLFFNKKMNNMGV